MFEGIMVFSTLEFIRGFIPKSWTNIREDKLTGISFTK